MPSSRQPRFDEGARDAEDKGSMGKTGDMSGKALFSNPHMTWQAGAALVESAYQARLRDKRKTFNATKQKQAEKKRRGAR